MKFRYSSFINLFIFICIIFYASKIPDIITMNDVSGTSRSPFTRFGFLLIYLVSFLLLISKRNFSKVKLILIQSKAYIMVLLYCSASVFWSIDPRETFERTIALLGLTSVALLLCCIDEEILVHILNVALKFLAICTLLTIIIVPRIAFHNSEVNSNVDVNIIGSLKGVQFHKNALGYITCISIVFLYHTIRIENYTKLRDYVFLLIYFLILFLSKSMTSLLIAMFVISLYELMRFVRQYFVFYFFLILFSFISIFYLFSSGLYANIADFLGKDPTLSNRIPIWEISKLFVEDKPFFGWGYSAFWDQESTRISFYEYIMGFQPAHAHNGYLQLTLELGFFGLILFLMFIFKFLLKLDSKFIKNNKNFVLYLALFNILMIANLSEAKFLQRTDFLWMMFTFFNFKLAEYKNE